MRIVWVNHASFILETQGIRMISDPWLEGPAFHDGWLHLSKTVLPYEDFSRITHIWFSHEHPDHFAPPNLKRIAPEHRQNIVVLYQQTKDKKVGKFCAGLGFKQVMEMTPWKWTALTPQVEIIVTPHTEGDSWMAVRVEGKTILNLNDCIIRTEGETRPIKNVVGDVDVLMTQFSYANWVGNKEDLASRRAHALEKLERIRAQSLTTRPKWVIPFASFVWFAHEENFYMNEGVNTVHETVDFITKSATGQPVVLYPGDVWEVDAPHDNTDALNRYGADYASIPERQRIRSAPVPMTDLVASGQKLIRNLRRSNDPLVLRLLLRPARIYLTDVGQAVELSLERGLVPIERSYERCDIAVGSDSVLYALNFMWGGDTLHVNGRFQLPKNGNWKRFGSYCTIASMNNRGERADWKYVMGAVAGKMGLGEWGIGTR